MKVFTMMKKDIKIILTNKLSLSLYSIPYILFLFFRFIPLTNQHGMLPKEQLLFAQIFTIPVTFTLAAFVGSYEFEHKTINTLYSCKLDLKILLLSKIVCTFFLLQFTSQLLFIFSVGYQTNFYSRFSLLTFSLQLPLVIFGTVYGYQKKNYNKADYINAAIILTYTFPPMFALFTNDKSISKLFELFPSTQIIFVLKPEFQMSLLMPLIWGFAFLFASIYYYQLIKQEYRSSPFNLD